MQILPNTLQEVSYLHRILSQTLLEVDVQTIFRYSSFISDHSLLYASTYAIFMIVMEYTCFWTITRSFKVNNFPAKLYSGTLIFNPFVQSRQVVQIFHSHITEAFSKLEVSTPQAKNRQVAYNIYYSLSQEIE